MNTITYPMISLLFFFFVSTGSSPVFGQNETELNCVIRFIGGPGNMKVTEKNEKGEPAGINASSIGQCFDHAKGLAIEYIGLKQLAMGLITGPIGWKYTVNYLDYEFSDAGGFVHTGCFFKKFIKGELTLKHQNECHE